MQIVFTDKEKKYLEINMSNNEYSFACKSNAPLDVKKSINKKLLAHKKWLRGET